nr:MAG TPA: Rubredoxin [Caudoviricetes sp.]
MLFLSLLKDKIRIFKVLLRGCPICGARKVRHFW